MADQNTPAEQLAEPAGQAARPWSAKRWSLIVLALGGAGALLIIAVIALQITEYRFYSAPQSAWPQPGAKAVVSAPAPPPLPLIPSTSAVAPSSVETTTAPFATAAPGLSAPAATTTASETATSVESLSPTGAAALAEAAASLTTATAIESIVSAEPVSEATTVPAEGATSALPTAAAQPEAIVESNEATPFPPEADPPLAGTMEPTPPAVGAGEVAVPGAGL